VAVNRTVDAFDYWRASEPTALHNLTIAEIWMAAYDQGRADAAEVFEGQIDDMADQLAELKAEEAGAWEAGA
jgi:hypothetical protein